MNDQLLTELKGMLIFARVVDSGSFAAGARRLGVSRAVVSYQIKAQEDRLGVRLLNRSTRRISLTAAGQQYYERCRNIVDDAEEAQKLIENLRGTAVGKVVMSCPVNLGLQWIVPVANAFRYRYPNIKLELQFTEEVSDIIQQGIDLAVRAGPLPDSQLQAVRLANISRHICASPQYLRLRSTPTTAEELEQHDWIVYSRGSQRLRIHKDKKQGQVSMQGPITTNNAAARLQFAISGQGLAVLPQFDAKPAIASGQLVELMTDHQLPSLELFAVFPQGATQARATRLMIDMLKQYPPDQISTLSRDTA